jgi:hypothetical protein
MTKNTASGSRNWQLIFPHHASVWPGVVLFVQQGICATALLHKGVYAIFVA